VGSAASITFWRRRYLRVSCIVIMRGVPSRLLRQHNSDHQNSRTDNTSYSGGHDVRPEQEQHGEGDATTSATPVEHHGEFTSGEVGSGAAYPIFVEVLVQVLKVGVVGVWVAGPVRINPMPRLPTGLSVGVLESRPARICWWFYLFGRIWHYWPSSGVGWRRRSAARRRR
jgi:hypothetical protein